MLSSRTSKTIKHPEHMISINNILATIFIILILILLFKTILESDLFKSFINSILTQQQNTELENKKIMQTIQNTIQITQGKINKAIESGIVEAFQQQSTNNGESINQANGYLTSYLNKPNAVKLQLFYKPSCPHCKNFMPVWTKILNNLPSDATYEEINCEMDIEKASQNKITSVPTLILIVNNEKKVYVGNRNYDNIKRFLMINGVNLVERRFEDFNNTATDNENQLNGNGDEAGVALNPHCPSVSFDKKVDMEADEYSFQIFNENGQYGYAVGGYNDDKIMNPFISAYSTVDAYLSSLPDDEDPTKNSYKNVNECATLYQNDIVNFGLCDITQLNNILQYDTNIKSGKYKTKVNGTDYSSNSIIVNAIKNVCGL